MSAISRLDDVVTKATPGPWFATPPQDGYLGRIDVLGDKDRPFRIADLHFGEPDAAAIVALHNAWPGIFEVLRAAEAYNDASRRNLEGIVACDGSAKPTWLEMTEAESELRAALTALEQVVPE